MTSAARRQIIGDGWPIIKNWRRGAGLYDD